MVSLQPEIHRLSFELTRPWALALLAVFLPALLVCFAKSLSDFPKQQRIASTVIRSLLVMLIVLSLAGFTWLHETRQQYVLFVIDRSLSIGKKATSAIDAKLDQILEHQGDHRVGFMEFDESPGLVRTARPVVKPPQPGPALPSPPPPPVGRGNLRLFSKGAKTCTRKACSRKDSRKAPKKSGCKPHNFKPEGPQLTRQHDRRWCIDEA